MHVLKIICNLSKAHETHDSLFAGCLDLSLCISTQFTLEVYATATNCKKNNKTPISEV